MPPESSQELSSQDIQDKVTDVMSYINIYEQRGYWTKQEGYEVREKLPLLIELANKAQQIKYKRSFHKFSKYVMGWPDYYDPLHKVVCDFIQDNIEKRPCLLLLPRGTFKSSVVTTGFPAWMIAKNPATRGVIANATYPMATQFLGQVKDVLDKNEKFREIYGDYSTDAPIWREDAFAVNSNDSWKSKEPTVSAFGVGSNYTGKHFDWAILDDLVNRDNIGTMDRIEEVKNFYKDMLDLVDPAPAGHKRVIVIGTTWHQSDLYSWIMSDESGLRDSFAILRLPAYGEFDEFGKFVGEWEKSPLLFPTRLTWEVMANLKKNQGPSHFSAQYLLDPVPPENAKFKNFSYYDPDDLKGLQLNKFMAIDPAMSEKKEADYSAIVVVGVDKNDTWYLLDIWRGQVLPKDLIEQILYMDSIHRPLRVGIEANSFQKVIRYYLDEEMKKRRQRFTIDELVHNDRSKEERILGLEPKYASRQVLHPRVPVNHKLYRLEKHLRDELERFPKSKNDDIADALASILEIAYPPRPSKHRRDDRGYKSKYPASGGGW